MCGVAGIIGPAAGKKRIVERMLSTLLHRGPDDGGVWCSKGDERVVLGHRRVSIFDLSSAGHQPMVDASGRFVLTYNGEICNYLEVAAELAAAGVRLRSHGDTEVLLEAYKRWGAARKQRVLFQHMKYLKISSSTSPKHFGSCRPTQ